MFEGATPQASVYSLVGRCFLGFSEFTEELAESFGGALVAFDLAVPAAGPGVFGELFFELGCRLREGMVSTYSRAGRAVTAVGRWQLTGQRRCGAW